MTLNAMQTHVWGLRFKEFGTWETRIKTAPMMNVSDTDGRLFLQFDHSFASDGKSSDSLQCIERMIGWANPDLIFLFKAGPVNTFIQMHSQRVYSANGDHALFTTSRHIRTSILHFTPIQR